MPLLFLRSPLMRCGKTTLLDGLHCLVSKPLGTSNITAAGMYRAIDADKPTFLIDELDSAGRERSEIRNILDAGHHRSGRGSSGQRVAQRLLPESPRRDWQPSFNHRRPRFRDPDETEGQKDSIRRLNLSRLLDKTESVRQRLVRWAEDNGDALSTVTPRCPRK